MLKTKPQHGQGLRERCCNVHRDEGLGSQRKGRAFVCPKRSRSAPHRDWGAWHSRKRGQCDHRLGGAMLGFGGMARCAHCTGHLRRWGGGADGNTELAPGLEGCTDAGGGGGRGGDVAVQEGEEGALERRKYFGERVGFPVGPQRRR